jgi:IS5 family transposase
VFRAQQHQIINMRQELVQLAGKIDWHFVDGEIAPGAAVQRQWSAWKTRFVIGFFLLMHTLTWMIAGTKFATAGSCRGPRPPR